jgi:hypothetical protein
MNSSKTTASATDPCWGDPTPTALSACDATLATSLIRSALAAMHAWVSTRQTGGSAWTASQGSDVLLRLRRRYGAKAWSGRVRGVRL